jgi:hypothetical protein
MEYAKEIAKIIPGFTRNLGTPSQIFFQYSKDSGLNVLPPPEITGTL